MNKSPTRLPLLAGLSLAWAIPGIAAPPVRTLEPVQVVEQVQVVRLVFDCDARALPSQRLVGEILGQHNFGQVYASRSRLMTEVNRACGQPGAGRVGLVLQVAPSRGAAVDARVARQEPAR